MIGRKKAQKSHKQTQWTRALFFFASFEPFCGHHLIGIIKTSSMTGS
jgi:hypothetical protein